MTEPAYQEFGPDRIPVVRPAEGVTVKVIAGRIAAVRGPISQPATDPTYLDLSLAHDAMYVHTLPPHHSAFLYVFEGAVRVGEAAATAVIKAGQLAVLSEGIDVHLAGSSAGADGELNRAILVAGRPLGEPVARYGPFVMNTREQIMQAVQDFQNGRF
jgi:redox-sensitive bicupin YhaK (pirin superfamily)